MSIPCVPKWQQIEPRKTAVVSRSTFIIPYCPGTIPRNKHGHWEDMFRERLIHTLAGITTCGMPQVTALVGACNNR